MNVSKCCSCLLLVQLFVNNVMAFQAQLNGPRQELCLHQTPAPSSEPSTPSSRRNLFGAIALGITAATLSPSNAQASYSAYTHREEDWNQRQSSGEVQYSNARALRAQLAEIAPANNSGRQLFCPNGATAAVSPLMENRCGDKLALPSVYGRTEDSMGNSIPGFNGGFYDSGLQLSGSDNTGGLPVYESLTTNVGSRRR